MLIVRSQQNQNQRDLWKEIEEHGPKSNNYYDFSELPRRDYFTKNYGWAIPDKNAIEKIRKFVGSATILSVAAGRGLWEKLMQDIGIQVIATDIRRHESSFTDIEELEGLAATRKHGNENTVLMFNWPGYMDAWPTWCLRAFKGSRVIYIGEGSGGCTADNDFHEELQENWRHIDNIDTMSSNVAAEGSWYHDIPQWAGIHDSMHLYVRK